MTTSTPDAPAPGLRERNRVRRTRRVERAALSLALEHGVENVTVDMICEASDISPRTYFNYFGTKEGALLGQPAPSPDESLVGGFLEGDGPIAEDLMVLMARTFLASSPDREVFAMRRRLFAREPELHALQVTRMAHKRQATAELVMRRLAERCPDLDADAARDHAQLVMSVAMGAFPVVSLQWAEASGADSDIETYIHAAIAQIRRIVTP
ncbi:TetR/AcrR family transcriptional regulator [Demequina mangrovi]|uniref:Transcriptional regulator, TetR family n=1 Tax=Demequina mangrovi TaxID=1043493 RepID=A0A1H6Z7Y2_9MICO|nr:TetR/AcrR family transcriptional regulator [Demequina mangrovi]SEJ49478.1 transcriptional regulator, TetR family [Demequina mangrovi]